MLWLGYDAVAMVYKNYRNGLDPTGVGAPTLDRLFNFVFGKVFFGCSLRQRDKLLVEGETEADDLAHGQPGIKQLSGKHVVTQVFFCADGAILGLQ